MPRRDVVLTGLIAFAAGCAVGANWPKIRKKIGPMVGKAGLQISELGEFLSESFPDAESFFNAAAGGRASSQPFDDGSIPVNGVHKNGAYQNGRGRTKVTAQASSRKKRTARRKPVVPSTVD